MICCSEGLRNHRHAQSRWQWFRPTCDLRHLTLDTDESTVPTPFSVFPIRQLLKDNGGESKLFSTTDRAKRFLQVPFDEGSMSLAAFSTNFSHFDFPGPPCELETTLIFIRYMAIDLQVLIKDQVPGYIGRYFNMVIFGQGPWRSTAQCFPAIGWSRIDNIIWQMLYLSLASRFPWRHCESVPAPFDTTRVKSFFGLASYYQYITNYKMKLALQAWSLKGFRLRTSFSENQIFCLGDPGLGKWVIAGKSSTYPWRCLVPWVTVLPRVMGSSAFRKWQTAQPTRS